MYIKRDENLVIGYCSSNNLNLDTEANNINIILHRGSVNDPLVGGSALDAALFSSKNNTINFGFGSGEITGDGEDILTGIKNVNVGQGNDLFLGNISANIDYNSTFNETINGGSGNNNLAAGGFKDTLKSGSGNENLDAEAFNETIYDGSGDDLLVGGSGIDQDLYTSKKISLF